MFKYNQQKKLRGEGSPDGRKPILGWLINTLLFKKYLVKDKARMWIKNLKCILKMNEILTKILKSSIGRLNHAGHILPQGRYFMN